MWSRWWRRVRLRTITRSSNEYLVLPSTSTRLDGRGTTGNNDGGISGIFMQTRIMRQSNNLGLQWWERRARIK